MKNWTDTNKLYLIGALLGAIGGFFYWKLVGCKTGTCMITSKPINSTLYGALLGSLILSLFKKDRKETKAIKE